MSLGLQDFAVLGGIGFSIRTYNTIDPILLPIYEHTNLN